MFTERHELTLTTGGVAVLDHIVLAQDRIKIVVAAGGNGKSGAFTVVTG